MRFMQGLGDLGYMAQGYQQQRRQQLALQEYKLQIKAEEEKSAERARLQQQQQGIAQLGMQRAQGMGMPQQMGGGPGAIGGGFPQQQGPTSRPMAPPQQQMSMMPGAQPRPMGLPQAQRGPQQMGPVSQEPQGGIGAFAGAGGAPQPQQQPQAMPQGDTMSPPDLQKVYDEAMSFAGSKGADPQTANGFAMQRVETAKMGQAGLSAFDRAIVSRMNALGNNQTRVDVANQGDATKRDIAGQRDATQRYATDARAGAAVANVAERVREFDNKTPGGGRGGGEDLSKNAAAVYMGGESLGMGKDARAKGNAAAAAEHPEMTPLEVSQKREMAVELNKLRTQQMIMKGKVSGFEKTALGNLEQLQMEIDAQQASSKPNYPRLAQLVSRWKQETGQVANQGRELFGQELGGELAKLSSSATGGGSGGTLLDREEWKAFFEPNSSYAQAKKSIDSARTAIGVRVRATDDAINETTDQIKGLWSGGSSGGTEGGGATGPKQGGGEKTVDFSSWN
jgi:hypothetical protein